MSNPEAGYYAEAASRLVRTGEHVAPHVVLQRKGDDALVKTVTDFVIASGYDEASGTWGQGRYFGDDAVSAFSAFNAAELYEDHLPGITAQGVLDREPGLTLEEAETVAFCANDNLACSDHFADLVYDQVGAEIEHVVDDFSPERRRAFDLEKRLLAGETLYNPVTGTYVDSNLDTDEPNYFVGNVEITAAASFIGERMGTGACFYDISDASPRDLPGVSMEYVEASGPRRDVAGKATAPIEGPSRRHLP